MQNRKLPDYQAMKRVLAFISISILVVQAIPAVANTQKKTPKTFLQWCQQKKSVPLATRSTINILLDKADTQNCRIANSKLNSLTSLDLYGNQISDIKPLASLTNLTNLSLIGNQIDRKSVV